MTEARAFPLVIAAPSGAGKTTLAQELVRRRADVAFSVSATTRAPRPGERHGEHYWFVDDAEFARLIERGELVEWAVVHDRRYGTPRAEVRRQLDAGRVVVLDIDVQGARQVRARLPEAVLVFVLPPSGDELVRRLQNRASETSAQLRLRMHAAAVELAALPEFDYVVVNDDLERAVGALAGIIEAESRRVARVPELQQAALDMAAELEHIGQRSP